MPYPKVLTLRAVVITLCIVITATISAAVQQTDGAVAQIRSVLRAQQDAWNRGDIDGFMNGYARFASTVFISEDTIRRGWQTVRDRYKKKYSSRAKMGTLTFSDVEITVLPPDSAVASGRWKLRRANDQPHGRFTLILRRLPEGWRIVHDHTSAAPAADGLKRWGRALNRVNTAAAGSVSTFQHFNQITRATARAASREYCQTRRC